MPKIQNTYFVKISSGDNSQKLGPESPLGYLKSIFNFQNDHFALNFIQKIK